MALIDPIESSLRKVRRQLNKATQLNRTRVAANVADLSTVVRFAWSAFQQCPSSSNSPSDSPPGKQASSIPIPHIDDELLTEKDAARILKTHPGTLANWRCNGAVDIPFVRIGRMIRYRRSTLEQMLLNGFDP